MAPVLVARRRKSRRRFLGSERLLRRQLQQRILVGQLAVLKGDAEDKLDGLLVRLRLFAEVGFGVHHRRDHQPQRRHGGEEGRGALVAVLLHGAPAEVVLFTLRTSWLGGCTKPALLVLSRRLSDLRALSLGVVAFGLYMPLIGAAAGMGVALALGLSVGGATLLAVLGASASYIVVPAVMRAALPQASPAIYLTLALGITFPFNLVVGIPLYYGAARALIPAAVGKANAIESPPSDGKRRP